VKVPLEGPCGTEQSVLSFVGEDVRAQALGDLLADHGAPDAVGVRIEPRRENGDAKLARDDGHDAAAHPALGGDADPIRLLAGEVVHAARMHNAQDVSDVAEGKSPLSSRRVHAAVCQRGCHDRQVLAGDVH
jgi:hypothetical protein